MKKLNLSSRVLLDPKSGKVITQIYLTKEILGSKYNQGLDFKSGWYTINEEPECPQPKPELGPGQYGEYICVEGKWVFIPA